MKIKSFSLILAVILLLGISGAVIIAVQAPDNQLDTVAVNDIVYNLKENWKSLKAPDYPLPGISYGIDYTVLDTEGKLLRATKPGITADENSAVRHRDTILSIYGTDDSYLGKLVIYNDSNKHWQNFRNRLLTDFLLMCFLFISALSVFLLIIQKKILRPFEILNRFAKNIAAGNLDIPLSMDKENAFGAFTESFDLMRTELATAKENEYRANTSKKELVASLSHDIKTPVASIKAIAELMSVTATDNKMKKQLETINAKADQINLLISNMFHATLEELNELKVTNSTISSHQISDMLHHADYQKTADIDPIPACLILADPLRLSQVLDNIISNSYKYAGTRLHVTFHLDAALSVDITDYGPGVLLEEIPLLTQKYFRGTNSRTEQGTGIGLYISAYFMDKMGGSLEFFNSKEGFTARLLLKLV
ncbi:HAMP domain-containing sensor histidine kinase [Anaerocolumna sp. AGMB13020]|uniref:HAMP domain-containing sensor histidine kinase n=1 Tax=Anaerocolumna sp. AGMB13020 TaxID=3081750 RepID=UPI002954493F|nr:HAMP domain-containing sensor histidine kinase [Anaerocolumna sp. AGMB13020]WOO37534.1 HAMP domain-containing sensor histidine kinase [Anaerocolumna sp. AGMB13020]